MKLWPATLLAAGVLVLPLSAQEERPVFQDAVDVEVLNLEVYVTDADGAPVHGLGRDDFELLLDGKPVEASHLYEVREGRRHTARPASTAGETSASAADPVFVVLFVDNLHLGQFTRNRALDELEGFLRERLRHDDQVMVVSFGGRLRLHQEFTGEWKHVERALGQVGREQSFGHRREGQERQLMTDMMALSDLHRGLRGTGGSRTRCPSEIGRMATRYAEDVYHQVEASVSGLSELVATLASLPGRKALVHLSDGIPFQPGAGVFEFLRQYCGESNESLDADSVVGGDAGDPNDAGSSNSQSLALGAINPVTSGGVYDARRNALDAARFSTATLFEELAERANAHRVTLFTVEATGARTFSAGDARRQQRRTLSRRSDEIRWASLQNSLLTMAASTGGHAILDTVDLSRGLDSVSRDLDTYYSMGYSLPKAEDGQTFRVEVKVKKKGLRVRHRESLRSESLAEELAGRTRAALMYGVVSNPLAIRLGVGDIQRMDALHMVPIQLRIPLAKVTLLPRAEAHRGLLRVFVTGRDRAGRVAQVRTTEVPITIARDRLEAVRSQTFLYEVRMLMREGDHRVAVGVYDSVGALASFIVEDVVVPDR